MMMRYLLNSAVLTAFGQWDYQPLSVEQATHLLDVRDMAPVPASGTFWDAALAPTVFRWESTIGYPETATALELLCGLAPGTIQVNRRTIQMAPGDEALVFRLVFPTGTRPDAASKGHMGLDFIREHCELGLLRRLA